MFEKLASDMARKKRKKRKKQAGPNNRLGLVIAILILSGLASAGIWYWQADREERRHVTERIHGKPEKAADVPGIVEAEPE